MMVGVCYRVVDPAKDGWNVRVYAQWHRAGMRGATVAAAQTAHIIQLNCLVTFRIGPISGSIFWGNRV